MYSSCHQDSSNDLNTNRQHVYHYLINYTGNKESLNWNQAYDKPSRAN